LKNKRINLIDAITVNKFLEMIALIDKYTKVTIKEAVDHSEYALDWYENIEMFRHTMNSKHSYNAKVAKAALTLFK
jgi:hypothetical protein